MLDPTQELPENLDLNHDFKLALDMMENSKEHLFITGKAGSGKSTLLRYFRKATKKNVVYLAPTGLAAVNVAGQTIHSFFGFPPRPFELKEIKPRRKGFYRRIDTIVIDEISMVRADIMDAMDYFLRMNAGNPDRPFGGMQMIFMGDLFQLPPVVRQDSLYFLKRRNYTSPYFFAAHGLEEVNLVHLELTKIYRQEDRNFLSLLEMVRRNELDYDSVTELNEQYEEGFEGYEGESWLTLCATNKVANAINLKKLEALDTPQFNFIGKSEGRFAGMALPVPDLLSLKEKTQVLFTRNDPRGRWVNGTIGTIVELDSNKIKVEITNPENGELREVEVKPEKWEMYKYSFNEIENSIVANEIGSYEQYPLKLAWAITIHKSQGMTFDRLILDMGAGAFAPGQLYVALSRCRSLEGIKLKRKITPRDVIVDPQIIEYAAQNDIL